MDSVELKVSEERAVRGRISVHAIDGEFGTPKH